MKLLMAVSKDGFVARSQEDDMSWTGPFDKAVFRLLSHVGGELACGSVTYGMLPRLKGRTVYRLSRRPVVPYNHVFQDLKWFQHFHPNGWLIGGQEIAVAALREGFVDQAFLCVSDRQAFEGIGSRLSTIIHDRGIEWALNDKLKVGDTTVEVWQRNRTMWPNLPSVADFVPDTTIDPQAMVMDKCGCRVGTACGNAACPHMPRVTCHVDPKLGI